MQTHEAWHLIRSAEKRQNRRLVVCSLVLLVSFVALALIFVSSDYGQRQDLRAQENHMEAYVSAHVTGSYDGILSECNKNKREMQEALDAQRKELEAATAELLAARLRVEVLPKPDAFDLRALVRVRTDYGSGTGVIVSDRRVLTAAHVCDGMPYIVWIDIFDPTTGAHVRTLNCKVLRLDEINDMALLETPERQPHAVPLALGAAYKMPIGQRLVAVGASKGHTPFTINEGRLSAKMADLPAISWLWQASFTVWFGKSGGAVFDAESGELAGLITAMDAPDCSYFVPAGTLACFLEDNP